VPIHVRCSTLVSSIQRHCFAGQQWHASAATTHMHLRAAQPVRQHLVTRQSAGTYRYGVSVSGLSCAAHARNMQQLVPTSQLQLIGSERVND
jgi:hypothetical protein